MTYTVDQIKAALRKKGYVFFDNNKDYNLNIIGVRRVKNSDVDIFDDELYLIYKINNRNVCLTFQITTEPGLYWLKNPMNKKGAAILVPGQYRGAYMIGLHRGSYPALIQIKQVKVYRDSDLDNEYDYDPENAEIGWFGLNIHKTSKEDISKVGIASAGCQVFQKEKDFQMFMNICAIASQKFSNSFTYTLLTESDFE